MKSFIKLLAVLVLVVSPVMLFAGSKDKDRNLASEIQQRLSAVAPNTVIVVVDEATKTAFLSGSAATQAELDRITETVRSIDGVRVIGSTMVVSGTSPDVTLSTQTDPTLTVRTETIETERVDPDTVENDDDPTVVVENRTVVDSSDASLRAAVEEALKSEGIIGQSKIRIETEGGIVTLTGAALSEAHANRIVALAQSVPGVLKVNPRLTIRDQKNRQFEPKPSDDRDKEGYEVGGPDSRVDDDDDE